jgi:hypothetical protein
LLHCLKPKVFRFSQLLQLSSRRRVHFDCAADEQVCTCRPMSDVIRHSEVLSCQPNIQSALPGKIVFTSLASFSGVSNRCAPFRTPRNVEIRRTSTFSLPRVSAPGRLTFFRPPPFAHDLLGDGSEMGGEQKGIIAKEPAVFS